jgi:hypothetical protein
LRLHRLGCEAKIQKYKNTEYKNTKSENALPHSAAMDFITLLGGAATGIAREAEG